MSSFVRKYCALTGKHGNDKSIDLAIVGLRESEMRRLFIFKPPLMGEFMKLSGAEFKFFYSIHTIPCIGFEYIASTVSRH